MVVWLFSLHHVIEGKPHPKADLSLFKEGGPYANDSPQEWGWAPPPVVEIKRAYQGDRFQPLPMCSYRRKKGIKLYNGKHCGPWHGLVEEVCMETVSVWGCLSKHTALHGYQMSLSPGNSVRKPGTPTKTIIFSFPGVRTCRASLLIRMPSTCIPVPTSRDLPRFMASSCGPE